MARTERPPARLARVAFLAVVLFAAAAHAGGMTLPGRGARPLGRAGSFVAGADDGEAMYYNPAGLAEISGISMLADVGMIFQRTHYERIDSGGNRQLPVDGSPAFLPFPTLVVTWQPQKHDWVTFHGGLWVPYLGLNSYPETGPQRYSNITLDGSLVVVPQIGASFRVHPHVLLGAGIQVMVLNFSSRVTLSSCSGLSCAPEDPGYDTPTQLSALGATPSAIVGAIFPWERFRIGLSLQLPFFIQAQGQVHSRLPTDPFFTNAQIVGDAASMNLTLPLMLRLGFEWRPRSSLRIELGADYEAWSMQRSINITPHDIYIDGIPGIGRYYLNPLQVVRDMQDSVAVHVGGEWDALPRRLTVRLGYLFETSATPDETLSVLTSDGLKNTLTLGLSVRVRAVWLDAGYGHIFYLDREVTNSRSLQLNPIQPTLAVAVGNGSYSFATDILSIGLRVKL